MLQWSLLLENQRVHEVTKSSQYGRYASSAQVIRTLSLMCLKFRWSIYHLCDDFQYPPYTDKYWMIKVRSRIC